MDDVRIVIANLISAVFSFLAPIQDFMTSIVVLFIVNFVFGLTADIVDGAGWKWKKAFKFFTHCLIFFALAASVYVCGHFMHNESGAIQCVTYICYVAIWAYSVNVFRNLKVILKGGTPLYKVVDIIYYVLTLKMVSKIPFLSDYLNNKEEKEENDEDDTEG